MLADDAGAHRALGVDGARQERLVAAAVQHRPGVVAHAAVDGDVRAHARDRLDRADGVDGDGGSGDDGSTGLDVDRRADPGRGAGVEHDLGPLADRRRLLAFEVGDPEAAAEDELGKVVRRGEGGHHLGGPSEALGGEDVGADVAVQPDEVDGGRPRGAIAAARAASPLPRLNPNFESSWPVAMYSWVWAWTPGVMRSSTSGTVTAAAGVEGLEAVELVEAVDDDVAHAGLERHQQLGVALVVAVQRARARRHAGRQDDVQLAAAGDVEQHPLVVGQAGHRPAEERLGRVGGPLVPEGVDGLAAAGAEVRLVVDEDRRAVDRGELVDPAAADDQRAVVGDRRRVRQEGSRQRAHEPSTVRPEVRSDVTRNSLVFAGLDRHHDCDVPSTQKEVPPMINTSCVTETIAGGADSRPPACVSPTPPEPPARRRPITDLLPGRAVAADPVPTMPTPMGRGAPRRTAHVPAP